MKLGIMQPYFFPYIGYWQLINAVDKYIVYDDVDYIKGGWINRNYILLNEQRHLLTLPLNNSSSFKKINEISVISNKKNKEKILKTITTAYKKAPYFDDVFPLVEISLNNEISLSNLLYLSILHINKYLDINTEILLSSNIKKDNSLKGQDKILELCKIFRCNYYLNAIGGYNLYKKEDFEKEGILLQFIQSNDIKYKQFKNEFVSNLSILDIMMFNDKSKIKEMLNAYTLF